MLYCPQHKNRKRVLYQTNLSWRSDCLNSCLFCFRNDIISCLENNQTTLALFHMVKGSFFNGKWEKSPR